MSMRCPSKRPITGTPCVREPMHKGPHHGFDTHYSSFISWNDGDLCVRVSLTKVSRKLAPFLHGNGGGKAGPSSAAGLGSVRRGPRSVSALKVGGSTFHLGPDDGDALQGGSPLPPQGVE